MIKIEGWDKIEELSYWCNINVGNLLWSNNLSEWIGDGWYISRISSGFKLQIDNDEKRILAALLWT